MLETEGQDLLRVVIGKGDLQSEGSGTVGRQCGSQAIDSGRAIE